MVCLGLLDSTFHAEAAKNQTKSSYSKQKMVKVEFSGTISRIDFTNQYMVVNQINVYVVSNKQIEGRKTISTVFVNEKGTIPFTAFKANQKVLVTGYKADDGSVFAEKIQPQQNMSVKNLYPNADPNKKGSFNHHG